MKLIIEVPPFELDTHKIVLIMLNNVDSDLSRIVEYHGVVAALYGNVISTEEYLQEESCKKHLAKLLTDFGKTEFTESSVINYLYRTYPMNDAEYKELYQAVETFVKSLGYLK